MGDSENKQGFNFLGCSWSPVQGFLLSEIYNSTTKTWKAP